MPYRSLMIRRAGYRSLTAYKQSCRQRMAHVVVVAEDWRSMSSPEDLPDWLWIFSHRVDQPLRVVIEGNVDTAGASFGFRRSAS